MQYAITVYPSLRVKYGQTEGDILSAIINLTAIKRAVTNDDFIKFTGSMLSGYTGIGIRKCNRAIESLQGHGVIEVSKHSNKTGNYVRIIDEDLLPVIQKPAAEPKKESSMTDDEKELNKLGYALYKKRLDFNPKFAGNKFDFLREWRMLTPSDAIKFADAVDAWIEDAEERKSEGLTGINNFLKSGEWTQWINKVSDKKLEAAKVAVPMKDGQYDIKSPEYKEYMRLRELKYGKKN